MKKISFVLAVALAAVMASCNQGPSATLKTDIDTLSYAIGMSQTQGLKEYLSMRMGVDTTYVEDFIKGFREGVKAGDDKSKAAFYAGIQIGQQVSQGMLQNINRMIFGEDSTQTVNESNVYAGFIAAVAGNEKVMSLDSANTFVQTRMDAIREAARLVGMEKLMWGSDYPRTITAITYRMSYDFITKSDEFTEDEKRLLLGENARRFYGFGALVDLPYIKNMSE